jgi:hypothetical protein
MGPVWSGQSVGAWPDEPKQRYPLVFQPQRGAP